MKKNIKAPTKGNGAKKKIIMPNKMQVKDSKGKKENPKKGHHFILIGLMAILIAVSLSVLAFCIYIMISAPDFDINKLYKSGSSIIYDIDGNTIAELGAERRENVTYDDLPEILVDAIVATEDSKYFQHSGIDLLRFSKAVAGQLVGHSDAGGGSTLTMQIVKNTYNGTASHGIKGIIRKFSDIYMAVFKLEKTYTKQEILEFYVNQPYLGGSSSGVEQASITYFGKSVGELNLSEASLLAGLFQAPDAFDPLKFPEKAQNRRNMVLGLMVRHGYITKEEAEIAKSIPVKSLLKTNSASINKYQGFVDTVVTDVINKTGFNPYTTSMTIYSTMKKSKQDVINDLYDGKTYKWKNDVVQCGIAVTDVKDGSISAIGTGRNRTGVLQYNYATSINRHPGSTAKPIFSYGPAIEYAGWGTGTFIMDDEYTYSNGSKLNNVDLGYKGIMTVKTALAKSRNVPALQAFQATTNEQKMEFVTNLGIKPELYGNQIMESASIGAFNGVSPLELSAAYGAFARGGYYIKPYSFTKIIYNDTNETYTYTPTRKKVMSEETAFMINAILRYAVSSGTITAGSVSGTDIASKTGTSSIDSNKKKELKLPSNAIADSWQVSYSPDYVIAFWYGYDEFKKDYFLTSNEGWSARTAIAKALTNRIAEKNARWTKPKGVVAVDIELETNPTLLASEYTPDNLRSTEYFKKGTEPTEVSSRFAQLPNPGNLTYTSVGNQIRLSWSEIDTPEAIDKEYLQGYFNTNYKRWATKYYQRRLDYNDSYIGILEYEVYVKNSDGSMTSLGRTTSNNFTVTLTNAQSATYVVKSEYSKFPANSSSGAQINVKINSVVQVPEEPKEPEEPAPTDPGIPISPDPNVTVEE